MNFPTYNPEYWLSGVAGEMAYCYMWGIPLETIVMTDPHGDGGVDFIHEDGTKVQVKYTGYKYPKWLVVPKENKEASHMYVGFHWTNEADPFVEGFGHKKWTHKEALTNPAYYEQVAFHGWIPAVSFKKWRKSRWFEIREREDWTVDTPLLFSLKDMLEMCPWELQNRWIYNPVTARELYQMTETQAVG